MSTIDHARLPLRHAWNGTTSARRVRPPSDLPHTPAVAPLSTGATPSAAEGERWEASSEIAETVAWASDEEFDHDVLRPEHAAPRHEPPPTAESTDVRADVGAEVQRAALRMKMVEENVAREIITGESTASGATASAAGAVPIAADLAASAKAVADAAVRRARRSEERRASASDQPESKRVPD